MRLSTHEQARGALAGLIRKFNAKAVVHGGDVDKFRALVAGLNALLSYFKFAREIEIGGDLDERLRLLEQRPA